MYRMLSAALLAAGITAAAASVAVAEPVERSGSTYHVAVCKRLIPNDQARCMAHVVTDSAGHAIENTTPRGYGPADLQSAYNITTTGSSSTLIAIVDAFGYTNAESDLATYRTQYGLPPCTTKNGCFKKLNQEGKPHKYPAQNISWADESALDLDMASAMCPSCKIILVEAKTNTTKNLAASVDTAASLGAHVISNSYSGFEKAGQAYAASYNHPGVAITAATGDHGFAGGAGFPATSPYVIAVGGTTLTKDTNVPRGWNETAWSGGGSGCSKFFTKPVWQTDTGCKRRMEADVSAVGNPSTGVAVYGPAGNGNSTWLVFGGTSVATPLVGGIYGNNGGTVTYGSDPYKFAGTSALNDVTVGNNGTCSGDPAYFCTAEVGYDGPTGLGTPNGTTAF